MSNTEDNIIEIIGCVVSGPFRIEPTNGRGAITYAGIHVDGGVPDRYQVEFRRAFGRAAYALIEGGNPIRIKGRVIGHLRRKEDGSDRLIPVLQATGFSAPCPSCVSKSGKW